jgi:hypothetical protein
MADDEYDRKTGSAREPSPREILELCRREHGAFAVSADDIAYTQQDDERKLVALVPRVAALAFRDFATLVSAVEPPDSTRPARDARPLTPPAFLRQCGPDLKRLEPPEGLDVGAAGARPEWVSQGHDSLLVRLCAKLREAWPQVDRRRRARAAEALVLVRLSEPETPDWADLQSLVDDLADAEAEADEEREVLMGGHDLVARYWQRREDWRRREAIKKPSGPPLPYSPRATFEVGQSVEHPTFGVGCVQEVRDGLIVVAFGDAVRRLAHTPPPSGSTAGASPRPSR